jgi:hypothetical protein
VKSAEFNWKIVGLDPVELDVVEEDDLDDDEDETSIENMEAVGRRQ